jgi:nicotinamidase-related amidase
MRLPLRTRVELFKGSDIWSEVQIPHQISPEKTAALICDVWDNHWCKSAARRCNEIVQRMGPVVDNLRAQGVQIIHAPSECMEFYKDLPQRKRMQSLSLVPMPSPLPISDPPLPIDDSDSGCDDEPACKVYQAWKRQHPSLSIADGDVISDNGKEVYSFLQQSGIRTLVIMGVHTNMCILNRSFAIRQMTKWGVPCILVRDLTDTMYNPRRHPFVPHEEGTARVIEHIEKYWCPTVLSYELLKP